MLIYDVMAEMFFLPYVWAAETKILATSPLKSREAHAAQLVF